jgi:hypothetical protein
MPYRDEADFDGEVTNRLSANIPVRCILLNLEQRKQRFFGLTKR